VVDAWLFVFALASVLLVAPALRACGTLPRFGPAPDFELPGLEACQLRYERRYRFRRAQRLVLGACFVYFVYRALAVPLADGDELNAVARLWLLILSAAAAVGLVAAVLAHRSRVRQMIKARPNLGDVMAPSWFATQLVAVTLTVFTLVAIGIWLWDPLWSAWGAILGCLTFVAYFKRRMRLMARSRTKIPPDSELGQAITQAMAAFGFEPKHLHLSAAAIANGAALPNGVVVLTAMLRHVMTTPEIAAVLAHELSHAKDGDTKLLQGLARARMFAWIFCVAGLIAVLYSAGTNPVYIVPAALSMSPLVWLLTAACLMHKSRALEFKCDAAAAQAGYGPELKSGLVALHRAIGAGHTWVGLDRRTMSHPSLTERLAALDIAIALVSTSASTLGAVPR